MTTDYKSLFDRCGYRHEDADIRFSIFLRAPEVLTTPESITHYDQSAAREIARLETVVQALKGYRAALAARFGQLETMAYTRLLKLERRPSWRGNIAYIITITRTFSDGTKKEDSREVFPGKERCKAIARYKAILKQYPGIPAEMDIEKRSWEK